MFRNKKVIGSLFLALLVFLSTTLPSFAIASEGAIVKEESEKLESYQEENKEEAGEEKLSESDNGIIYDMDDDLGDLEIAPLNEDFSPDNAQGAGPLKVSYDGPTYRARAALPEYFNLRDYNRVTPVKNQGTNGSCWAFAAYGAMESYLSRFGSFDFSEKHMRNMHGFDWSIDDGGNRDIAAAYLSRGDGPIWESQDPYDPVISASPLNVKRALDMEEIIYLPDVLSIGDTVAIKNAIMQYGGVYTTINSSKYYERPESHSYYNPGGGKADHAVTIVGWDDSFSKNGFSSVAPDNGAWIVKNSWGPKYMDNGFYYVSYFDKFCGKSNAVFVPKAKDETGEIYQYDKFGATRSVGYNKQGYMANIFKASRDELLHEVGLYNVALRTRYEIYVVENLEKTSQLKSDRKLVAEGFMEYPGYYTIDIDPVKLTKDENFSVVVYMNSEQADYRYPMPIETRITGFTSKAEASPGQSYVSADGESWGDLTRQVPNANACIKAITTAGDTAPDEKIGDEIHDDPHVKPRNLYFKEGKSGFINVDKKGSLTAIIEPEALSTDNLKFKSQDNNVAVYYKGAIYPRSVGKTVIQASTEDGSLKANFFVQVIPKDFRNEQYDPIPVLGENDFDPKWMEEIEPSEPDYVEPTKPEIEYDPNEIRNMYLTTNMGVIKEGDTFDLDKKIGVYPKTANREFTYLSNDESIITVDKNGIATAHKTGKANVSIECKEGFKKEFNFIVLPRTELKELSVDYMRNSERKAGIWTVTFKATENGEGYSGPADVTTVSGDRVEK